MISRMSPSVDNNALMQKVGKVVNSPEFNSDTILKIVDSPNITHPVGLYIQKEFDELQYDLGRAYEDHPEEVAEKLLSMLKDRTQQGLQEGRWNNKSSSKTSRAVQGKTEVIVRHARPVDEEYAGARSQKKNIKAIFIQNHDGERFKYPFIHPSGAFAMAQHVDHGGIPHDPAGKAIINMSEQIAQLQEFQRKVHRATLHDDATGITERALGRLQELKMQVESLGKRQHYESWISEFNGAGNDSDMMMDDVTMEEYKQKFTQSSFQEELSAFFPLLHKIMSETNTVDLEDFVNEADGDNSPPWDDDEKDSKSNFKKPNNPNRTPQDTAKALAQKGLEKAKSPAESIDTFEEWADATEQGKLTPDQIDLLKQAIETQQASGQPLQLGVGGATAWDFFNGAINPEGEDGVGFGDELHHKLDVAATEFPDTDAMTVFQTWAEEEYPELLLALGMSGDEQQEPQQQEPQQQEPQQQEPVAEGQGIMVNGKEVDMRSLEIDGVDPRDYPDFSDAYISYALFTDGSELNDEEMDQLHNDHGDLVHELAYDSLHENEEQGGMPNKTMPTREAIVKEVAKLVKSRFNEDNPDVGPFNGAPNIALDIKKKCAEMFGEDVGDQAESLALEFMEKLSQKWSAEHGAVQDDGLARLKELLGNVKAKVEGIGDQGQGGRDFNKNIMPAQENSAFEDIMRLVNYKK